MLDLGLQTLQIGINLGGLTLSLFKGGLLAGLF